MYGLGCTMYSLALQKTPWGFLPAVEKANMMQDQHGKNSKKYERAKSEIKKELIRQHQKWQECKKQGINILQITPHNGHYPSLLQLWLCRRKGETGQSQDLIVQVFLLLQVDPEARKSSRQLQMWFTKRNLIGRVKIFRITSNAHGCQQR